jgi:hypothetical protein
MVVRRMMTGIVLCGLAAGVEGCSRDAEDRAAAAERRASEATARAEMAEKELGEVRQRLDAATTRADDLAARVDAAAMRADEAEKKLTAPKPVFLADMGPELAQAFTDGSWGFGGHGTIGNAQFSPITVGGTVFPHGLGTQPPSNGAARVHYALDRKFSRLTGKAGVNDTSTALKTGLVFHVVADGREVWHSGPIKSGSEPEPFDVDLKDVKHLELSVTCPGANTGAHAVWLDPVLAP